MLGEWADPDPEFPLKGAGERVNAQPHLDLNHRAIVRTQVCTVSYPDDPRPHCRIVEVLHDYDPVLKEARAFLENA